MKKILLRKFLTPLLVLFLISPIISCSKKEEKSNAESSYTKAMKSLKNKSYTEAAEAFAKIEDEFPFSKWAIKGQTMATYAYYKAEDRTKLLQITDDFLRLNPASEYVPYMMYMKGLSYYDIIPEIDRAQDNTQQASFIFRELIARFPNSEYAIDAKEKLGYVDEHLAAAKMSVGRYQIKSRNYVGAIVSFREIISRYRQTNQVAEAYFRLAEIYYKIGLKAEGKKAYHNLKSRYPQSEWTKLAEKII